MCWPLLAVKMFGYECQFERQSLNCEESDATRYREDIHSLPLRI